MTKKCWFSNSLVTIYKLFIKVSEVQFLKIDCVKIHFNLCFEEAHWNCKLIKCELVHSACIFNTPKTKEGISISISIYVSHFGANFFWKLREIVNVHMITVIA